MNPTDWQIVEAALDAALDAPEAARMAAVRAACGARTDLIPRVMQLLDAADASGDLFDRDARTSESTRPKSGTDALEHPVRPGQRLGAWQIERSIGRGGMGEVFLASRADGQFEANAAVKVLTQLSADQSARFLRERQFLADLDHPGVARLLDGGVDAQGRPFTAMEYVDGTELLRYCHTRALDRRARLGLFLQLCDAVTAAHASLVVHRDIKPGNVLVTDDGLVKLLDFGIATVAKDPLAGADLTQALVTPNYAAPEQLAGRAVTTATDIHALGGVLHALLTEQPPWMLDGCPLPVVLDRITHLPAPAPSETAAGLDHPPVPPRELAGDLDAICARAMRKEPDARYRTVNAMANDVRRHLDHAAVHARQGNARYHAARFVRRHRTAAGIGVLIACLLAGAFGLTVFSAQRAADQRDVAQREAARLYNMREAVLKLFQATSRQVREGQTLSAAELFSASAETVEQEFSDTPATAAALLQMLGQLLFAQDDLVQAKPLLGRAIEIGEQFPADVHPDVLADARYDLSQLLFFQGDVAGAERLYRAAFATWDARPAQYRSELIWSASMQARLARQDGRPQDAVSVMQQAADDAQLHWGRSHPETAIVLNNLVIAHYYNNDIPAALTASRQAWSIWEAADRTQSSDALATLGNWGVMSRKWGDLGDAETAASRVVTARQSLHGPSAALGTSLWSYAGLLSLRGEHAQALASFQRAEAMLAQYGGTTSVAYVGAVCAHAEAMTRAGQRKQATDKIQTFLNQLPSSAQDPLATAKCRGELGHALALDGRFAAADAFLAQAESALRALDDTALQPLARVVRHRAIVAYYRNQTPALPRFQDALALYQRIHPPHHYNIQLTRCELGRALVASGDPERGLAMIGEAVTTLRSHLDAEHGLVLTAERLAMEAERLARRSAQASAVIGQ